jgi:predicted nucleotidyltransferase
MGLLESLNRFKEEQKLEFMVIGGHAVNAYGYSRTTLDLDILVPKPAIEIWKAHVLSLGFTVHYEASNFFQCTPPNESSWPLDFMLVTEETFAKLLKDAVGTTIQNVRVKVPSILHLIALKLHVLKQGLTHRMFRDMDDVLNLIQINQIDVRSDNFREICHRYGTVELYEYILRAKP